MSTLPSRQASPRYVKVGLVYRSVFIYRSVMKLLYGAGYARKYSCVADAIPAGSKVVDLCCGDCVVEENLSRKGCTYLGLDINQRFLQWARSKGIDARFWDGQTGNIPEADVVCMQSSLYHFMDREDEIIDSMLLRAKKMVIISEPVVNVAAHGSWLLRKWSEILTTVGGRTFNRRYDLKSIARVAAKLSHWEVVRYDLAREVILVARRKEEAA